jgi:hypothetical protein
MTPSSPDWHDVASCEGFWDASRDDSAQHSGPTKKISSFVIAAPVLVTIKIGFSRYAKMHAASPPRIEEAVT